MDIEIDNLIANFNPEDFKYIWDQFEYRNMNMYNFFFFYCDEKITIKD